MSNTTIMCLTGTRNQITEDYSKNNPQLFQNNIYIQESNDKLLRNLALNKGSSANGMR